MRAGVAAGIDFVALSFVRRSEDIVTLRELLKELGSTARIVAKIEDQTGLEKSGGDREGDRRGDGGARRSGD